MIFCLPLICILEWMSDARFNEVVGSDDRFWLGERRDCALLSVAVVTGIPYKVIHEAFTLSGRVSGRGSTKGQILSSLERLGVRFRSKSSGWEAKTLVTLERDPFFKNGDFVVLVRNHALPVIDGEVLDHYKGKRSRIQSVIQIL